jgi:hypothetical protein
MAFSISFLFSLSNEMFSSTELVRKSKNIFDKLNKNEIEKAIILRDGKPGIILMDFNYYEQLMSEYISLKNQIGSTNIQNTKVTKIEKIEDEIKEITKSEVKIIDDIEFSFNTDLAEEKVEPLKEFWDK